MKNNTKVILSMILVTAIIVSLYIIRKWDSESNTTKNNIPTVQVEYIKEGNIEKYKRFSGSVTGVQEEALSPKMPSNVISINVKKNDTVKQGQVLMVFDSSSVDEQVEQAKSAYEKASLGVSESQNKLSKANSQLDSLNTQISKEKSSLASIEKELAKTNIELEKVNNLTKEITKINGTLAGLEMQKVTLEKSLSSFDNTNLNSQVEQLKKVYDSALQTKESFTLKAPFNGVVTSLNAKVGETPIGLNPPIVISDISELSLDVTVSQKDIGLISVNNEYIVSVQDKKGKIKEVQGKVSSINSQVNGDEKIYDVKIKLSNKEKFESGSYAEVYIPSTKHENTLVVPKSALFRSNEIPYVYIVSPENKVKKINVTLGIENNDSIEILSGLRPGNKVITRGKDLVSIGEIVNIVGGDK